MVTLNQNGIDFNNISFIDYTAVSAVVSADSANKIAAGKGSYVTNAVTIDWNGAVVGENKTLNTTGEVLSRYKVAI